ncbi:MAG: CPBP family intramembrane metalloprotease [Nitrospirae bacterium]|nr:CPBP family intramembrane metalloprotease [Nitrospirota bacterium]
MVSVYHAFSFGVFKYLIPLFLLTVPYLMAGSINMKLKMRDIYFGVSVSALVLLPFWLNVWLTGSRPQPVPLQIMAFQLFGISLPEEAYFRGFLQECLGNNLRGVFLTSILFAIMHLPQLVFYGDWYSLMTFFPSLVMGFIYMKTSNILPSVIFHFAANILFLGLYDILSHRIFPVV